MRLSPLLPLVLIAFSIAVTAASAHAQEEPSSVPMARLDFASEGEGCPDAGTFTDEVSARIGRVGFDDASEQVALVRIARTTSEALVTAEFGGNTRVFRDADCRVAAEAAAAAIAVWLDEPSERVGVLGALMGDSVDAELGVAVARIGSAEAPSDGRVLLRVTTNLTTRDPDEDFSFHIETNTGRGSGGSAHFFDRLCLMPCETRVAPGAHQFGLSQGTAPAWALEELTRINADSELHIEVRGASPVNLTGRWLAVIGVLVALPLSIVAIVKRDDWGKGTMWGIVGVTGGLILGANLMIALSDDGGTEVTVRPL